MPAKRVFAIIPPFIAAMSNSNSRNHQKLGVMFAGLGSVSSTMIAGVEAIKAGLSAPIGSQALTGRITLDGVSRNIGEVLPLASLNDIVFGGWDIFPDSAYDAAKKAKVLGPEVLEKVRGPLEKIRPYTAVFDPNSVRALKGTHVKTLANKREWVEAIRKDIREFKKTHGVSRVVVAICNSTESYRPQGLSNTMAEFEKALDQNAEWISPSVAYAAAAIEEGASCINGTPSVGFDAPALLKRARELNVPLTGKDLKTGQTLLKTVLAPAIKARMLGLSGWYSTNILGNRDGEVLSDPESNRTKIESKQSVLSTILNPELYPELYGHYSHKVRIDYYPPRGDNKEAWDNIDIFGWLNYPMQIKVNFLCRDSILAAPLVLDLILFSDLAKQMGRGGIQTWLSLFHKCPVYENSKELTHDFFLQYADFEKALVALAQEQAKDRNEPQVVSKISLRRTAAAASLKE